MATNIRKTLVRSITSSREEYRTADAIVDDVSVPRFRQQPISKLAAGDLPDPRYSQAKALGNEKRRGVPFLPAFFRGRR